MGPLGDIAITLRLQVSHPSYGLNSWVLSVKFLSGSCYKTTMIISQHWCRWWRGIVRQQAFIWVNIGPDRVYPKKYAHGYCFAVLCCGYTLTNVPISIRLTSLALWQSNDCPSASKATLMNMDKYFMWIHYERLHNYNKAKHNKTVCIFLGIYCTCHHMASLGHNEVSSISFLHTCLNCGALRLIPVILNHISSSTICRKNTLRSHDCLGVSKTSKSIVCSIVYPD